VPTSSRQWPRSSTRSSGGLPTRNFEFRISDFHHNPKEFRISDFGFRIFITTSHRKVRRKGLTSAWHITGSACGNDCAAKVPERGRQIRNPKFSARPATSLSAGNQPQDPDRLASRRQIRNSKFEIFRTPRHLPIRGQPTSSPDRIPSRRQIRNPKSEIRNCDAHSCLSASIGSSAAALAAG
jgi:hypothetical protein